MHVTQINMAKTGYLFLAKGYKAREEDIAWMKEFGCDSIVIEEGIKERLRPQWRKLLTPLKKGDEIVLTRLSNAVRGIRELGAFLDLCRAYRIRIVSIHDKIDTKNEYFPETTAGEVLDVISRISEEATKVRRSEGRIIRELKTQKKEKTKSAPQAGPRKDDHQHVPFGPCHRRHLEGQRLQESDDDLPCAEAQRCRARPPSLPSQNQGRCPRLNERQI